MDSVDEICEYVRFLFLTIFFTFFQQYLTLIDKVDCFSLASLRVGYFSRTLLSLSNGGLLWTV